MANVPHINEIEQLQCVENGKSEFTNLNLSENEGRKKTEGGKNTLAGMESELDNAEVKKEEIKEFLSKEKGADTLGKSETEGAADEQSKNESKEDLKIKEVIRINYNQALSIEGLPLRQMPALKKMLLETFGDGTVKVKPRLRDEINHFLFFATEANLKQADKMLNEKKFLKYELKAKIVPGAELRNQKNDHKEVNKVTNVPEKNTYFTRLKRKMGDQSVDEPKAKREKETESMTADHYFYEEDYNEQVVDKNKTARKIVEDFTNNLKRAVPQLEPLICNRQKKENGFLCKLDELHECPPAQRLFARCKFIIGEDEETGEPAVGFSVGGGKVTKNYKAKEYFLSNVIEAAEVFEKLVKSSKREPHKGIFGFWCKLIIRSSTEGKLMLTVNVQAYEEQAQEELSYLKNLITDFYETGEGKNTNVTSVYSQITFIDIPKKQVVNSIKALSWGKEYLEENFHGMRLLLDPKTFFLFNAYVAGMICDTVVDMLKPTKRISVIEMGCCSGFIGMHLAKYVGEVLCVGTRPAPTETVLKEKSSKCQYFPGASEKILRNLNISNAKACAVITTRASHPNTLKTSLELRKLSAVKRVILIIEDIRVNGSQTFTTLIKPSDNEHLGNPFFPMRISPVDTAPNAKHFMMVVLLERISMQTLPKFDATEAVMKEKLLSPRKNMPSSSIGPNMDFPGLRNIWNENRGLPVGNLNFVNLQQLINMAALNQPHVGASTWLKNQITNPMNESQMVYADILQKQEFMNNGVLAKECRQRLLEERKTEEYRQRLREEKEREAEEYKQRLLEEKEQEVEEYRRRLIEEKEEYQLQLQEKRAAEEYRQMQRLRELEEEYKQRLLLEKRERELMALKTKPPIQYVLADSIKEAALSGLDSEAAFKLKHIITEAIKGAGILNTEEKAMQQASQDKMPDAAYSRNDPKCKNLPDSIANPRIIRYAERTSLQLKDNILGSKRGNRELIGSRKSDDDSCRVSWKRKDVSAKSLADRDVPFIGRKPIGTSMVQKDRPVSLFSLKFPPDIEDYSRSSMQKIQGHEAGAENRWRGQNDNRDKNRWLDGMNKGAGLFCPWRPGVPNSIQSDSSNVEPYPRDVLGMRLDEWRSDYANKGTVPENREAYGSKSSLNVGKETKRSLETDYQRWPVGGSKGLMPTIYGHTNASQLDSFRKTF